MSSRWKKVWADFWGNKSRTFLTIITITVGVLAVGFNSSLGLYMAESMDGDYLSASPSEATVYAGPLDDDMVKIAREVPGVDAVEGRRSTSATVVRTDDKKVSIQFTAVEDPAHTTLNQLKPALGETGSTSTWREANHCGCFCPVTWLSSWRQDRGGTEQRQAPGADLCRIHAQCNRFSIRLYQYDECLCHAENTGLAGWFSRL